MGNAQLGSFEQFYLGSLREPLHSSPFWGAMKL
jgi:hypothetical protein